MSFRVYSLTKVRLDTILTGSNRLITAIEMQKAAQSLFRQKLTLEQAGRYLAGIDATLRPLYATTLRFLDTGEIRRGNIEGVFRFCQRHQIGWDISTLQTNETVKKEYIEALELQFPRQATLFHYEVTALASPHLAHLIKIRYNEFKMSLVPQIRDHVRRKFGDAAKVAFINLLGSASSYQHYEDIDIVIGLVGESAPKDEITIEVTDEKGIPTNKRVEIFYYDINHISGEDYIRFIFSKYVLFGEVPKLYSSEITGLLWYAINETLEKFDKAPNERKSMHLLAAAFRHIYSVCRLEKRELPAWFAPLIKALYLMENNQQYDRNELLRIRNMVYEYWTGLNLPISIK